MSITGIGSQIVAGRAVAGRHAPPARRPAAPARHRQEVRHLCRPRPRSRPRGRAARASCRARRLSATRSRNVGVRLNLAQTALGRIADIGHDGQIGGVAVRRHRQQRPDQPRSRPPIRSSARCSGLLNTQAGDRYLFSGRATDQPAVETLDHIMDGDGARAGLKQIDRRAQAGRSRRQRPRPPGDLGADR